MSADTLIHSNNATLEDRDSKKSSVLEVKSLEMPAAQKMLGLGAALMMVFVWSGYFLSLRAGAVTPISTFEIAMLRFGLPGLILLPVFFRNIQKIRQVPVIYLLGMLIGGGLPFFWLGAMGMQLGQVAEGSTLIPGVAPLFVTMMAVLIFNQPLSGWRLAGLILIFSGVIAFIANSVAGSTHVGAIVLFLSASFLWALFALSIRQCGLSPLVAASTVAVPTGTLLLLSGLILQPELGWFQLTLEQQLGQLVAQGLGAGLASGLLFAFAISRLGAEVTSAIGSLTPVAASAIAYLWFGEEVTLMIIGGIALISLGVVLASGMIKGQLSE
ncbi:DMT family transporter [Oceanospirillum sanctuarii]|uniref:DMT family transporter n=1 Tax=Oceanospirillum sanctuarii TaxID=1434821 RepID=UPI00111DFC31|nr:DMT family transporter [Oceanospirillum sanctuarii]